MKDAAVTDVLFGINSVESRLLAGKQGVHTLTVREGPLSRRVEALVELYWVAHYDRDCGLVRYREIPPTPEECEAGRKPSRQPHC